MEITQYTVEKLTDPVGLIQGERYEFHLYVQLNEEDELYDTKGTGIRTILAVGDGEERLVVAHFFNRATGEAYPFDLEDEEYEQVLQFCLQNYE